jgi:energy-coupling factor transport system permease protein
VVVPERTDPLRTLHPLAWWCWAIGIGLAVNGTTNPLLLTLVALAMVTVVMLRRSDAPWARSVRAYLLLAAFVIGMRMLFQLLIGARTGATVLFVLPEVPLPDWAAGISLGGPVTAEALAATLYDALRLAVMLLCIGAANALASPRQALRSVPAALYEASVAVVVALSVAPQLIESGQRIHRARRLRGDTTRGLRALGRIALAVLADAVDRSMSLAAGMEARGFARTRGLNVPGALPLMLASTLLATSGGFVMLATDYRWLATALLVAGVAGVGLGLRRASARLAVTRYRPHPWRLRETCVAACGVLAMVVVLGIGGLDPDQLGPGLAAALDPLAFFPSTDPLAWPQLNGWMLAVVLAVLAPIPLTASGLERIPDAARTDVAVRSPRPLRHTAGAAR